MSAATMSSKHWLTSARPDQQPTPWWSFRRAVYVSRRDYWKSVLVFIAIGIPLAIGGLLTGITPLFWAAVALAVLGLVLLAYSLIGLYRMYGPPARRYMQRLIDLGAVRGPAVVADVHIGTYRHAYALADLLPESTIHTIDCWDVKGPPAEAAIQDVRELEPPPTHHARIRPARANEFTLP